jgi:hypothetical protein
MRANPLLWLHFRLTGAWRTNVVIVLVYAALVAVIATASYRMMLPEESGQVSSVWLGIISAAQGASVLLLGLGAIRRAVLRDFQTGMLESHRLTPMSSLRIVVGYLIGPPVQAAWLFLMGLVLGTYFALDVARQFTTVVISGWYALQLSLLILGFMLAGGVLLSAISTAGKANVVAVAFVAFVILVISGGMAAAIVPGLALISGTLSVGSLFSSIIRGTGFANALNSNTNSLVVGAVAQIAFGVVFVAAACRKVRGPHRAMFGMALGLLLTALWAVTLVLGIVLMPPGHWLQREFGDMGSAQLVASTGAFMLVALFPLVGAAVARFHGDRAAAFAEPQAQRRGREAAIMPVLLGVLAMATLVCMYELKAGGWSFGLATSQPVDVTFADLPRVAAMLIAMVLAFWVDFYCVYWVLARGWRVFVTVLVSALIWKVLPLVVDLAMVSVLHDAGRDVQYTDMYCAGFSPVGTLMLCISGGNPWPGLIGQVVLAVAVTRLAWSARRAIFAAAQPPTVARILSSVASSGSS